MITPANQLPKKVSTQDICEFLENYIMDAITKANHEGYTSTCATSLSISYNRATGELQRGLVSKWVWYSLYDKEMEPVLDNFRKAGYNVFSKPNSRCIYIGW